MRYSSPTPPCRIKPVLPPKLKYISSPRVYRLLFNNFKIRYLFDINNKILFAAGDIAAILEYPKPIEIVSKFCVEHAA